MDLITGIISEQNYELLKRISEKKYNNEEDRKKFINKYYKRNYLKLRIMNKNKIDEYKYKINTFNLRKIKKI